MPSIGSPVYNNPYANSQPKLPNKIDNPNTNDVNEASGASGSSGTSGAGDVSGTSGASGLPMTDMCGLPSGSWVNNVGEAMTGIADALENGNPGDSHSLTTRDASGEVTTFTGTLGSVEWGGGFSAPSIDYTAETHGGQSGYLGSYHPIIIRRNFGN